MAHLPPFLARPEIIIARNFAKCRCVPTPKAVRWSWYWAAYCISLDWSLSYWLSIEMLSFFGFGIKPKQKHRNRENSDNPYPNPVPSV